MYLCIVAVLLCVYEHFIVNGVNRDLKKSNITSKKILSLVMNVLILDKIRIKR